MSRYGVMTQRWGWQPTARMLGGLPTWAWRCAPAGLLTRRQMRAVNLAPGGAEPVAQVICKRGRRTAYLYDPGELVAKRTPSPAQLAAVAKATKARRWCPTGQHYADYCIPTSWGECVECHSSDTTTGRGDDDTTAADREQTQARELIEHDLGGHRSTSPTSTTSTTSAQPRRGGVGPRWIALRARRGACMSRPTPSTSGGSRHRAAPSWWVAATPNQPRG